MLRRHVSSWYTQREQKFFGSFFKKELLACLLLPLRAGTQRRRRPPCRARRAEAAETCEMLCSDQPDTTVVLDYLLPLARGHQRHLRFLTSSRGSPLPFAAAKKRHRPRRLPTIDPDASQRVACAMRSSNGARMPAPPDFLDAGGGHLFVADHQVGSGSLLSLLAHTSYASQCRKVHSINRCAAVAPARRSFSTPVICSCFNHDRLGARLQVDGG